MQTLTRLSDIPDEFVIALPHVNSLLAQGEQALDFLHGQLTIHTKRLEEGVVRPCAHCDAKGKAWSVLNALRMGNDLIMVAHNDALQSSLQQFKKYGVFSKVTFSDLTNDIHHVFACGNAVKRWSQNHFDALPTLPMQAMQQHGNIIVNQSDIHPGAYHLMLTTSVLTDFTAFMQQQSVIAYDIAVYEALHIRAGIPAISGVNINQFVPQMFNLQLLNGIDFDKGCYMGQEVIARTRYLGKNKRAALVFQWPEATNTQIGATVEKQLGEHWRNAGTIIRCATLGNETWVMAIVANDTQLDEQHRLADVDASPIFSPTALLSATQ